MLPNKKVLIISALLIGIFAILIWVKFQPHAPVLPAPVITFTPQPSSSSPAPSNTNNLIQQEQDYIKSAQQDAIQNKAQYDQDAAVGKLVDKLPYQGTNFSLSFDYKTFNFTAVISKDHQTEGNQELDNFLKSNGILDRSWVKYLVIQYQ